MAGKVNRGAKHAAEPGSAPEPGEDADAGCTADAESCQEHDTSADREHRDKPDQRSDDRGATDALLQRRSGACSILLDHTSRVY